VVNDFAGWPRGPLFVAIGMFDGVHVGHQTVLRSLVARARGEQGTAIATTFDPAPIEVLAPGAPPSALSDLEERCRLLETLGTTVAVFHFDRAFSEMSPEGFARRIAS